jgi:hypothetical protein
MRLLAGIGLAVLCCAALGCLAAADKQAASSSNSDGADGVARQQLFSQLEKAAAAGDLDLALAVQKQLLRISRKQESQRRKLLQPSTERVSCNAAGTWLGYQAA